MPVYNVSYDLNSPEQEYEDLIEEIKKCPDWCHVLQSTWMVRTPESADDLSARLRGQIDDNDHLLVIESQDNKQGWLPENTWDCIDGLFR